MIVLDTHAWIWWVSESPRLSEAANAAISESETVYVSAISGWEVALKASLGKLEFDRPTSEWLTLACRHPGVEMVPLSADVAIDSVGLPGDLHRDPCDRFIVAPARKSSAALVTKDQKLLDYPHVNTLW